MVVLMSSLTSFSLDSCDRCNASVPGEKLISVVLIIASMSLSVVTSHACGVLKCSDSLQVVVGLRGHYGYKIPLLIKLCGLMVLTMVMGWKTL